MSANTPDIGRNISPGQHHYRAFIGATQTYDLFSSMQFSLMTLLGLRQEHTLLDIGCGSLRAGKLFLMYLLPERYFGIEPEEWLVREGIEREIGEELASRKKPRFAYSDKFPCSSFGVQFDFLLAQSIFSQASIAQIELCLREARSVMKPSSIFAASFVEGDSDYEGSEWVYPETIRFRASTIERLAREAGLECRRVEWFHIGGQTWFIFFLPGLEPHVDDLASLNQVYALRQEMSHYRMRSERLERIEANLLFRILAKLRRLVRR
jgi:hypothetical protein